jgi:hypothetical protein
MEQIQGVYEDLHFDGLWIDMNEPSNYCTGDVCWNSGEHLSNAGKEPIFHACTISVLCHGTVISQSLGILQRILGHILGHNLDAFLDPFFKACI